MPHVDIKTHKDFIRTGGDTWYGMATNAGLVTNGQAFTANVMRAWPFMVRRSLTIDRIGVEVAGTAAVSFIIGIYNSDSVLYPSTKIVDSGEISASTTGLKTATISETLARDKLYYLSYTASGGTASFRALVPATLPLILGDSGGTGGNSHRIGWTVARTYDGTMPSTFTASATNLFATGSVFIPNIMVRVA
jgi:hypothetical protein